MRSSGLWLKVALACGAAVAIVAGCTGSTAGGNAAPGAGAADGGTTSGIESAASGAAAAAADAGQRAAGAMRDAAQAAADAGAQAYGAAKEKVAEGATTAADAARNAAGMAADAGAQAMDAGAAAGSAAMDRASGMAASAMDGGSTASADAGPAAAPANDAQIAAIAHAANAGDILKSKLAKTRSKNAKVKAFANLMIKDHSALDAQAKKLGVTPEDNETSQKLTQGAQDAVEKLTPLKGKEFDTAYVDNEVQSHEKVLKALDEQLIPNAKDAKLKALLQTARAKVQMHLEHAQKLQSSLSK